MPLHRSLIFWLGLCFLVFLSWTWNRALTKGDDLGFPIGPDWIVLRSYDGKLEATRYPGLATKAGLHKPDWSTWSYHAAPTHAKAPWPSFTRTAANPITRIGPSDTAQSPYGFLLLCYLPLWLGLSIWRARRIAAMRKQTTR